MVSFENKAWSFAAPLMLMVLQSSPLLATTIRVSSGGEFQSALSKAHVGDTISLAPGLYGSVSFTGSMSPSAEETGTITIESADKSATINSLNIEAARNLSFVGLSFKHPGSGESDLPAVSIKNCKNIQFQNTDVEGYLIEAPAKKDRKGFPAGVGLRIENSQGIAFQQGAFERLSRAIDIKDSSGIKIGENEIRHIRSYGIDVMGATDIEISNNHIHDFWRSVHETGGHNMIHFGTEGTHIQSRSIKLLNNFLDSGLGSKTQSIFLGNEAFKPDDTAAPSVFEDVEIRGNVIHNAHIHGISIAGGVGVRIENNTLLQSTDQSDDVAVPHILFEAGVRDLTIRNNLVPHLQHEFRVKRRSWNFGNNHEVQRSVPAAINHYQNVFVNALASKTMELSDLAIRPDSPLAKANAGSPLSTFQQQSEIPSGYIKNSATTASGLSQSLVINLYRQMQPVSPDDILAVDWAFGDNNHQTNKTHAASHRYRVRGTYAVTATVELRDHSQIKLEKSVQVGN